MRFPVWVSINFTPREVSLSLGNRRDKIVVPESDQSGAPNEGV